MHEAASIHIAAIQGGSSANPQGCMHGAASIHKAASKEERHHSTEPPPQGSVAASLYRAASQGEDMEQSPKDEVSCELLDAQCQFKELQSKEEQRRSTALQPGRCSVTPQSCMHEAASIHIAAIQG